MPCLLASLARRLRRAIEILVVTVVLLRIVTLLAVLHGEYYTIENSRVKGSKRVTRKLWKGGRGRWFTRPPPYSISEVELEVNPLSITLVNKSITYTTH